MKRYTVSGPIDKVDKDNKTVSINGSNYKVKSDKLLDSLYDSVGENTSVVVETDDEDSYVISMP